MFSPQSLQAPRRERAAFACSRLAAQSRASRRRNPSARGWRWLGCLLIGALACFALAGLRAGAEQSGRKQHAQFSGLAAASVALANIVVNSAADGQVSEVQQVTITGAPGTFTLTFNGQTTGALGFNTFPFQVESALNGLSTIGGVGGAVRVSRAGNVYTVVFGGSLAATNVPQITAAGMGGAVPTVSTVQDAMPNCPGPNCTLRSAIAQAAPGDTIQFGPLFNTPQTITLVAGDLFIEKSLTIQGPGAKLLTVNGNNNGRVFTIPVGAPPSFPGTPFDVTLSGLTITSGNAQLATFNGGLGGGIYSNNPGTLNLVELVVTGNTATSAGQGGGLELDGSNATANIIRSTISGNTAGSGGGINMRGNIILNIINSTIACNTATSEGGGIAWSINTPPPNLINLVNSTIVGNQAGVSGGGIHLESTNQAITARNSIIALNTAPSGPDIDSFGIFVSQGYNLIGSAPGGFFTFTQPTDKLGVNPLVELDGMGKPRLADNGGPTPTIALLPGSPAIDMGGATPYNEVQFIAAFNQSGTFRLTFNGQTTGPLPFNATGAQVAAALNALPTIGGVGGSVTVIHSLSQSGGFADLRSLVLFGGTLAGNNLPLITVTDSTLDNFIGVRTVVDGGPFAPPTTDQRGFVRPVDQPNVPNATGGNGSDIGAFEVGPAVLAAAAVDPAACTGPGNTVSVTVQLTNPSATPQTASFTSTLPTGLRAVPGACTSNVVGASCTVAADQQSLIFSGTLAAGQTATITYQAQVADAAGGAQLCITTTATITGVPPTTVTACVTVNCPTVGPGLILPAVSEVSDQKAGSVLVYNLYSSNAAAPNTQNTRISITNTSAALPIAVHLFFVDGATCSIADAIICLTQNQTASFLASDLDPGTTGYVVAVASDPTTGCPVNFNFLIGDAYVKLASGHAANLGAEAFSALAGGLTFCNQFSVTAQLNFDGISYNRVPRTLAASNIPARADGNDTLLVINRFGGNLAIGAATLTNLFGIFYDDAENGLSFTFSPGTCQFRSSLSNNFPRTTPRLETFIPAGRSGWLRLYSASDIGLLGAVLNFNPNATTNAGAFNQGRNLHKLTLSSTQTLIIPIFPPNCRD